MYFNTCVIPSCSVFLLLFRPKLKNIDRSSAQQLAITVGNVTVIITDFKEKTRSSSTSSSTVTSSAGSEQQHLSSSSESTDKGSSRASTPRRDHSSGQNETLWRGRDSDTPISLDEAWSSYTRNCTWKRDLSNPFRQCPSWHTGRNVPVENPRGAPCRLMCWCSRESLSRRDPLYILCPTPTRYNPCLCTTEISAPKFALLLFIVIKSCRLCV